MNIFHLALAVGMLVTGSLNTITTKAADLEYTINRAGARIQFSHPFFQAACMFLGEFSCLVAYAISNARARSLGKKPSTGNSGFNPLILILPATCDLLATSTMYVGLGLTDASIFQMLRGSVVVFTGIFSVVFLKRKLRGHHWCGMLLVVVGTAIVGSQSLVCPDPNASSSSSGSNAMIGNVLIIVAQLVVATQMVVEEKFLSKYDLPALKVVGLEGLFGFIILSVLLVVMYYVPAPGFLCSAGADCSHFEDAYDAFVEMGHSSIVTVALCVTVLELLVSCLGNIVSIAFFNFLGVSITKYINASTRMVLDSLRTMVIWVVSLALGWESFCWVEIIGFVVLIAGTIMYNALVRVPGFTYDEAAPAEQDVGLLDEAGFYSEVDEDFREGR